MPKKMHKKVLVPLYGVPLYLVASAEESTKIGQEMPESWAGMAGEIEGKIYLVIRDKNSLTTNIVTHEAVHAAWSVLGYVGVVVEKDNHEALAYLTGWIAQQANNFFSEVYPDA